MNWPAALYAAGIWLLAAAVWAAARRRPRRISNAAFGFQVARELVGALLLGLVIGLVI